MTLGRPMPGQPPRPPGALGQSGAKTPAGKPFVPIPPQIAEAEDLLAKLQELLAFLKSTEPDSDKTRQTAMMVQQLEAKLKQVLQRVRLYGSPEPNLAPKRKSEGPPPDPRKPEDVRVLTTELSALGQNGQVASGPEVMVVQQVLLFSGFAVKLNGQFDAATVAAVRSFQTRSKLPVTGKVDEKTRPGLNRMLRLMRAGQQAQQSFGQILDTLLAHWELSLSDKVRSKLNRLYGQLVRSFLEASHVANPGQLLEPAAPVQQSLHSLMSTAGQAGIVSKGPEVSLLQGYLLGQGYDLKVNETFDLQTFTALKAFQAKEGLPPHGQTDPNTNQRINLFFARQHAGAVYRYELETAIRSFQEQTGLGLTELGLEVLDKLIGQSLYLLQHPEAAAWPGTDPAQKIEHDLGPAGQSQKISHGPEVLLLQELLQTLGYELPASEVYDAHTAKAVRAFQTQHKLPLSGMVDAKTREALNQALDGIRTGQN